MEININIIPDYKKEEISQTKRLWSVLKLGLVLVFISIVFLLFLLGLNKTLDLNLQSVALGQETGKDKEQYDKIRTLDEKFSGINSDVNEVMSIKRDQLYWSKLFILMKDKVPGGVELTGLINKDYNVSLSGKADNRDSLISFKESLEKEDCFSDINLPLSNLVERDNIVFQMDFQIKEECLHPQNK
jgi:Tfp pilus assembly protein PilN